MKTVKELLSEGKAASYSTPATPSDRKVKAPPTLLFRRTAIRTFPDNHIVALYYSSQLDKYVSIPFGPEGKALTIELSEAEQLDELFPVLPYIGGAVAAGARVAAPAIGRGVVAGAAKVFRYGKNLIARQGRVNKAKDYLRQRNLRKNRKGLGIADKAAAVGAGGIGGAVLGAASNLLGFNDKQVVNPEHEFDKNIGKAAISNPQSALAGASPITNYRQKQNQNYIWNTQPRAGQVQESLNRIIENKKSEVISGIEITPTVAKKLVNLQESLNTENKQNFEKMFEKTDTLRKVINFSLRK
jgi:hypothetical protein